MKNILKYVVTFISMIIIFCILLTITSLIPKEAITKKVKESSEILNEETNNLCIYINKRKVRFDNWTDSLMINTAYSIDNSTPFYSSMMARKNYIKGKTLIIYPDSTGELKSSSNYKSLNQVGDLNDTVNNNTFESFEYARYWHGYLIFLRPLLLLFNITQIRSILLVLFAILGFILVYMLYRKIDLGTAIIFLFGLFICDYFLIGISLQGTSVFLIMTIASILILSKDIKDKYMFFLIIGGLTSFFDFLTVPILTLGMPLLMYSLVQNKNKCNIKELFIELFKFCIMWGIGYLGIWIFKWILVDVLYHKNLFKISLEQFKYRSNYNLIKFKDIIKPIFTYIIKPFLFTFMTTCILTIIKLIKYKDLQNIKYNFKEISVYIFIILLVCLWILALKEHCYQHRFFTYRNILLISDCIFLIIYNFFTKIETDENKKEKINGK